MSATNPPLKSLATLMQSLPEREDLRRLNGYYVQPFSNIQVAEISYVKAGKVLHLYDHNPDFLRFRGLPFPLFFEIQMLRVFPQ